MSAVAGYRLSMDEMTAAAAAIGCRLDCPYVTRGTVLRADPAAVMVTNNATETRWWQDVAQHCTAICLIRGRLRWKSTLCGQIALYFGADRAAFTAAFAPFGAIGHYLPDEAASGSRWR